MILVYRLCVDLNTLPSIAIATFFHDAYILGKPSSVKSSNQSVWIIACFELELLSSKNELYFSQIQGQMHQQQTSPPPNVYLNPLFPHPDKYNGDSAKCRGFLTQCKVYFKAHPSMTESAKLTHFMNFLTKKALTWGTALW